MEVIAQGQDAVRIITQNPEEIEIQRKSISITQDQGAGMTMIITQPNEMMIKIVIQERNVMLMVEIVTLAQDDAMKMMKIGTLARDDAMEMMKIVTLAQDGVMMMMEIVTLTQDGVMMKMKIVTLNQDGITTKIKALSQLDALSSIETPRTSRLRLKKPGCRQKRRKATARRGAEPLRLRIRRRALPAPLQALQALRPRFLLHQAKKEIGAGSVIGAAGRGAILLLRITEEDGRRRRKRRLSRRTPRSKETTNLSRCFRDLVAQGVIKEQETFDKQVYLAPVHIVLEERFIAAEKKVQKKARFCLDWRQANKNHSSLRISHTSRRRVPAEDGGGRQRHLQRLGPRQWILSASGGDLKCRLLLRVPLAGPRL